MNLKKKLALSTIGVLLLATGINIILTVNVGYAAFDSITLVVHELTGLTFGNASFMINMIFLVILIVNFLKKKKKMMPLIISFISVFIVTRVIDLFAFISDFTIITEYPYISFILSVFIVVFGVLVMGRANLVIPPYDKFVVEFSKYSKIEFGRVRLFCDGSVLIVALIISNIYNLSLSLTVGTIILSFGLGTIVAILDSIIKKVKEQIKK